MSPRLCLVFLLLSHACNRCDLAPVENVTISADTPENGGDGPLETQSAACSVIAGDMQASAQATLTRELTGVCASKDMMNAFEMLEKKLMFEFILIKNFLNIPGNEISLKSLPVSTFHVNPYKNLKSNLVNEKIYTPKHESAAETLTYFWKIDKSNLYEKQEITSPIFYMAGHGFRIRAIPYHLNANYLYLQLEPIIGRTLNSNAFKRRYTFRFSILDQLSPANSNRQLTSQLLENSLGYRIHMDMLQNKGYISQDGLSIKLILYL